MEGAAQDEHVHWRSLIAAETADEYEDSGAVVEKSTPKFAPLHPILRIQWIGRTVIRMPNYAFEVVLDDVMYSLSARKRWAPLPVETPSQYAYIWH